jgi:hypothetical protein
MKSKSCKWSEEERKEKKRKVARSRNNSSVEARLWLDRLAGKLRGNGPLKSVGKSAV